MTDLAPLHLELRRATHDQHEDLDATLDILDEQLSVERYTSILDRFSSVYEYLENSIDTVLSGRPEAQTLSWERRKKLPLLEKDLAHFGCQRDSYEVTPVAVTDFPSVLGTMCVMEGATLGARVIAPHVQEHLGLTAGYSFFRAYGSDDAIMWKEFRGVLEDFQGTTEDRMKVVGAAQQTFRSFRSVLPA